jgi:hypothetical protein
MTTEKVHFQNASPSASHLTTKTAGLGFHRVLGYGCNYVSQVKIKIKVCLTISNVTSPNQVHYTSLTASPSPYPGLTDWTFVCKLTHVSFILRTYDNYVRTFYVAMSVRSAQFATFATPQNYIIKINSTSTWTTTRNLLSNHCNDE